MTRNNQNPKPTKTPGRYLRPEVVDLVLEGALDWNEACLLALLEQVASNGNCFMGNKYLAEQMRLSDRRVRLMLEKLEGLSLIERQHGNRRRIVSSFASVKKRGDSGHT